MPLQTIFKVIPIHLITVGSLQKNLLSSSSRNILAFLIKPYWRISWGLLALSPRSRWIFRLKFHPGVRYNSFGDGDSGGPDCFGAYRAIAFRFLHLLVFELCELIKRVKGEILALKKEFDQDLFPLPATALQPCIHGKYST